MEDNLNKRVRSGDSYPEPSPKNASPPKRSRIVIVPSSGDGKASPSAAERDAAAKPIASRQAAATTSDSDESDDDDYTSSSGSDSDGDDNSEDGDQDAASVDYTSDQATGAQSSLPRISAQQKPRIQRIAQNPDLLSRLSAFLPKMKNANDDLEREIAAGRGKELQLDEIDDTEEGRYIEMNLGLGVLEEQRGDDSSSAEHDMDDSMDTTNDSGTADGQGPPVGKDSDILDKLLGKKKSSKEQKPEIQELSESRPT
ncbi:NOPCHAP1/New4 family protein [Aspergillus clavatus NRRL 1]|uniref:Uncharacterized protein n=1 Tax=Aspergillus clavatus (strain ATCC 1007 / CBS 513.65 / DSM 816 / NCTC 3887 / NRRL 1 / QM 1276 / 107) TaxID=344612 RepID=A1CPP8_ASPCL|nr:uncharacterized protein ACLA_023330 [Aspergillus clavatus NRRL 1]EAW07619.1 conserved hypothetical protein [Aspergillus clavatus NRRL 1]